MLTGFETLQNQIVIINVGEDGKLTIDSRFHNPSSGSEPGIRLESEYSPPGGSLVAVPHGAVFSQS